MHDIGGTGTSLTAQKSDTETGLYYYRARYYDPQTGRFLSEDRLRSVSSALNFYSYVENTAPNLTDPSGFCPADPSGEKSKCPGGKPDPRLRLVPISDCSKNGQRTILYSLVGPDGSSPSCWWVTEHVDPKWWVPAAPTQGSPEGQSTGDEGNGPGGFWDGMGGWSIGSSDQTFTVSPQDPRKFPGTPSYPVIVRLPTGPNGNPQDFGTLRHFNGGMNALHCINGNCTGWVPCIKDYDSR
jgi:RHS repeat-associated protein